MRRRNAQLRINLHSPFRGRYRQDYQIRQSARSIAFDVLSEGEQRREGALESSSYPPLPPSSPSSPFCPFFFYLLLRLPSVPFRRLLPRIARVSARQRQAHRSFTLFHLAINWPAQFSRLLSTPHSLPLDSRCLPSLLSSPSPSSLFPLSPLLDRLELGQKKSSNVRGQHRTLGHLFPTTRTSMPRLSTKSTPWQRQHRLQQRSRLVR